jgi:hypothetical protein
MFFQKIRETQVHKSVKISRAKNLRKVFSLLDAPGSLNRVIAPLAVALPEEAAAYCVT